MNWEIRWRILSDVITDLLRRGGTVPSDVINDLRSAKVMLEILKVDRSRPENIARLETYLSNVEAYVLSAARERFDEKYIEGILKQLCELKTEGTEEGMQVSFQPGLPKEKKWVRVKITDDIPLNMIEEIAGALSLKFRVVGDEYVLIYGEDKELKDFIRQMAKRIHVSGRNVV